MHTHFPILICVCWSSSLTFGDIVPFKADIQTNLLRLKQIFINKLNRESTLLERNRTVCPVYNKIVNEEIE
jgi:hypothetical protein